MKPVRLLAGFSIIALFAGVLMATATAGSFDVTQHHNHQSRDGLFIDPAFTSAAAASLTRDLNFSGVITGNVYAQPLYIENGPGGASMVIAVSESNNVYALNSATGAVIWQRNVGTSITSGLPCGNISPLGITNTPVVDLATRSLFFDAETTPTAGTFKHLIYSLNVDTGDINTGWPVDVAATVSGFTSSVQSSRAAATLVGNILYVPYGGRFGDCGGYRGRVVGVQINDPTMVMNWATTATGGGVWGVGGVASDGTNTFVTTGNTFGTGGNWGGGEAVIRLMPGPIFSGSTTDYWAPTNWFSLDNGDTDLGGSGPILVDVPGATPSALVVALGKDGNAYLLNRNNLGGVTAPVAQSPVGAGTIIQAAATYRTTMGTYVVFRRTSSTLTAFRITATSPPTIATGWTVSQSGRGSPFVTSVDGTNDVIVWVAGAEGDQRLHGYNGDTGATVFAGGGTNELMTATRKFNTGIAARGRIYYAADNKVYAFSVPTGATPTPTPPFGTPTPTPPPTPTPTPTPVASPTPFNCTLLYQNFDTTTPPNLPSGWFTSFTSGPADCTPSGTCAFGSNWVTTTNNPFSGPICVFHDAPACVTDSVLDTPSFSLPTGCTIAASFEHSFNLENGRDGGVLEISINNGPFVDIVTAGGSVNYNGTISTGFFSPIAGRAAWTGNSGGYVEAGIGFPSAALGQQVTLRFRLATDCAGGGGGWFIDVLYIYWGCENCTPPPTPTPTPGPATHFRVDAPSDVIAGQSFSLTVTAQDQFNHTVTNYPGTVHFTNSDPNHTLPPDSTLTNGVGHFTATLGSPGDQGITATDTVNSSITGTSNLIIVHPSGSPTPTPTPSPTPITPTPTPTASPTPTPGGSPAQALNISTRLRVETGSNVAIGGFIVTGTAPKNVVVRGVGPSLTGSGVPDALADPTLELRGSNGSLIMANDNWQDDPNQAALITDAGLGLQNPAESGIAATLQPGNSYTAVLAGKNQTTGVGLVEIYDTNATAASQLANISTRGFVQTGSDVMIGGFILGSGGGNSRVVVRGIGPSLAGAGINPALADPTLELRNSNGTILAMNDNWQDDPNTASQLTFLGLAPQDPLESGIYQSVSPGLYTAVLAGKNAGTGIGLIEVYNVR